MADQPAGCRLYVVVEAGEAASALLAAALSAADVAAVLIVPAAGERLQGPVTRALINDARRAGITSLVLDDAALARTTGADGVHVSAPDDAEAAYAAARAAAGKDAVVGVSAGISRHAAMVLAEAGADYVAFGAPPHLTDRDKARARREELVAWWAPIFEVPCVAFDVETPEEAADLALAGADFVAVALPATLAPDAARDLVASVAEALRTSRPSPQGAD